MGYLQEADRRLDVLFADLSDGKISYAEMKRDIRERILDSYRNGLKANGQSPAPQGGRPPRRFRRRSK
jgi:hypothetical protein